MVLTVCIFWGLLLNGFRVNATRTSTSSSSLPPSLPPSLPTREEQTRSRLLRLLRDNETPWHYTMSPLMARVALRQGGAFVAGSCLLVALCGVSYVVHQAVDTAGDPCSYW